MKINQTSVEVSFKKFDEFLNSVNLEILKSKITTYEIRLNNIERSLKEQYLFGIIKAQLAKVKAMYNSVNNT